MVEMGGGSWTLTQAEISAWECGIFRCPNKRCNLIVPKGFTWCVACYCTMLYDPEGKIAPNADATMRVPEDAVGAKALTRVKSLTEENLWAMAKYFSAVSVDSRGPKTFSGEIWNTLKQKLVWRGQWDQWSDERKQNYANGGNSRWYTKRNLFNVYEISDEPGKEEYMQLYKEGVEEESRENVVGICTWPLLMGELLDEVEPLYVAAFGELPTDRNFVPEHWRDAEGIAKAVSLVLHHYDPHNTEDVRRVPGRLSKKQVKEEVSKVLNAAAMGMDWGPMALEEFLGTRERLNEEAGGRHSKVPEK